ncbi:unnamed protein product [Cylicocyclus nassatus]|uniref:Uncharacterized protein n=1 Tax=Cylicocyclus nassatus TaxID=53992 RepID=A0AA36H5I6_CYLNA|nr:unnamed protein product [Cylicocyclus nassatus]
MIVGSGILGIIFSLNRDVVNFVVNPNITEHIPIGYRQFSDTEIKMMYEMFAAVTLCANLIFALSPSREVTSCIEGKYNKMRKTFKLELDQVLLTFMDKRMITLTPLFFHNGFYTIFWVCVYPTTLVFSKSLSNQIYLPAIYSFTVGAGEITMGVIISLMSKRIKNFGLKPTMYCALILTTTLIVVLVASVPAWATVGYTDAPAWLMESNMPLMIFIAFLIGLGDSCVNNVRNVICALAIPDQRAQAYAISKFYQAFAGAILMFTSPYLSIYHYGALLFCSLLTATVCFIYSADQTKAMEKEHHKKELVFEKISSIEC